MFRLIDDSSLSDAGSLWGVRVCGVVVGIGAVVTVVCSVLFAITTFLTIRDNRFAFFARSFVLLLVCLALSYALIQITVGLFQGSRRAQLGGIAWGVLLLLFCWMLVHDAQRPINHEAPDAQEMDGPMFLVTAPIALWLIGYLSTKRVTARFLSSRAEE